MCVTFINEKLKQQATNVSLDIKDFATSQIVTALLAPNMNASFRAPISEFILRTGQAELTYQTARSLENKCPELLYKESLGEAIQKKIITHLEALRSVKLIDHGTLYIQVISPTEETDGFWKLYISTELDNVITNQVLLTYGIENRGVSVITCSRGNDSKLFGPVRDLTNFLYAHRYTYLDHLFYGRTAGHWINELYHLLFVHGQVAFHYNSALEAIDQVVVSPDHLKLDLRIDVAQTEDLLNIIPNAPKVVQPLMQPEVLAGVISAVQTAFLYNGWNLLILELRNGEPVVNTRVFDNNFKPHTNPVHLPQFESSK